MKKAPTVNNSTRAFPFPIWLIPGKPSTFSPAQLRQYLDASSGSWASGTTSTTRPGSPGSTLSYEKTTPRGWSFSRWKGPPLISSLFLSQKFSFSPLHGDVPKRAGIHPGFRGAFRPKTFREDCFPKVILRSIWKSLAVFSAAFPCLFRLVSSTLSAAGQVSSVRRPGRR